MAICPERLACLMYASVHRRAPLCNAPQMGPAPPEDASASDLQSTGRSA
eukprot:CAMPEP_0174348118 /NCGR_PEP_ID=MMETSP0811_2-20130205/4453_1 /TAXON_ID=73025 ORGANISM="Eutreptiella gymnastica-like, Strain CCMP1594" /NCGR_SAMPLE_ID=MMETSP0811_2 /ASSEMBLY_ACC=CAM_ASM_000667 /LENGTH=48 /DNA_ID= /DNA_START= /DNA_END= /DNA_ORIENTATION=